MTRCIAQHNACPTRGHVRKWRSAERRWQRIRRYVMLGDHCKPYLGRKPAMARNGVSRVGVAVGAEAVENAPAIPARAVNSRVSCSAARAKSSSSSPSAFAGSGQQPGAHGGRTAFQSTNCCWPIRRTNHRNKAGETGPWTSLAAVLSLWEVEGANMCGQLHHALSDCASRSLAWRCRKVVRSVVATRCSSPTRQTGREVKRVG